MKKNNLRMTSLVSFVLFCGGVSLLWLGCGNADGNKKMDWQLASSAAFPDNGSWL
jgi:hypothetical protein